MAISEQDHLRFVRGLDETGVPQYTFTLSPRLEVALSDRGGRKLSEWERNRIAQLHAIGINKPAFGVVIDNSDQSPQETAEEIITAVWHRGRAA